MSLNGSICPFNIQSQQPCPYLALLYRPEHSPAQIRSTSHSTLILCPRHRLPYLRQVPHRRRITLFLFHPTGPLSGHALWHRFTRNPGWTRQGGSGTHLRSSRPLRPERYMRTARSLRRPSLFVAVTAFVAAAAAAPTRVEHNPEEDEQDTGAECGADADGLWGLVDECRCHDAGSLCQRPEFV